MVTREAADQLVETHLDFLRSDMMVPDIKPLHLTLEDGETKATAYPITSAGQVPAGLLSYMNDEMNMEIERGQTYPIFETLELETYKHYWFDSFACILLIGSDPVIGEECDWSQRFLGTFYIKPNYPGRCSHNCNGGFVVNSAIRGKRIGSTLGRIYLKWAPRLGYTYSVFNLVFETNVASVKIWERLGFEKIGRIKGAARLRGYAKPVDAIMYGKDLLEDDPATFSL